MTKNQYEVKVGGILPQALYRNALVAQFGLLSTFATSALRASCAPPRQAKKRASDVADLRHASVYLRYAPLLCTLSLIDPVREFESVPFWKGAIFSYSFRNRGSRTMLGRAGAFCIFEKFLIIDCNLRVSGEFAKKKNRITFWNRSIRRHCHVIFLILVVLLISACNASDDRNHAHVDAALGPDLSLSILGYNYTNRAIAQFTVNGNGGDSVEVSTPNSGGSGTTCCVRYDPDIKNFSVVVRWVNAECIYRMRTTTEGDADEVFYFYKQVAVPVKRIGDKHKFLEIHFYPNGEVQAVVTDEMSAPELKLSPDRIDRSTVPRCKNDEKPVP